MKFKHLLQHSSLSSQGYLVPSVIPEVSTANILTSELVAGVAIDKITHLSLEVRNSVARRILALTMTELFEWKFMQTDPNWSNFMYNAKTDEIALIDFGAARDFDSAFVDEYLVRGGDVEFFSESLVETLVLNIITIVETLNI